MGRQEIPVGLKGDLNMLLFGSSLFNLARMFPGAIYTVYLIERGISIGFISLALSLQMVVSALLSVPSGIWADRYGNKRAVQISVFMCIFSFGLLIFPNHYTVILAFILEGLGLAFYGGALESWMLSISGQVDKKESSKTMSRFSEYSFIAMVLSGYIGARLNEYVYHASSVAMIITLAILSLPKEFNFVSKKKSQPRVRENLFSFARELKCQHLLLGVVSIASLCFALSQPLLQYWQPFLQEGFNFNKEDLGLAFAILMIGKYFILFGFRKLLLPRFKRFESLIAPLILGSSILLFSLEASNNRWSVIFIFVMAQSLLTIAFNQLNVQIAELVSRENRTTIFSVVHFLGRMIGAVYIAVLGLMMNKGLISDYGWMITGYLLLVTGISGYILNVFLRRSGKTT